MPFYNYSDKILPNLCKGVARSKGVFILLAYAREILGDYCRGFDLQLLRTKILPNLCKGVARSKGFLILLAYACEILGIIAEDLIYNYSDKSFLISARA